VDLRIDSDNNDGLNLPDGSDAEKSIKDDPSKPGKYVLVNDNDDNLNRIPDFAEFSNPKDQFVPVILKLVNGLDLNAVQFRFRYDASDPAAVQPPGGTALEPVYVVPSGHLRLWKRDANGASKPTRDPQNCVNGGDFIPADTPLTAAQLGLTQNNLEVVFDLEAVRPSATPGDLRIAVEIDEDGIGPLPFEFGDAVRATAVQMAVQDRAPQTAKDIVGGTIGWLEADKGPNSSPQMPQVFSSITKVLPAGSQVRWSMSTVYLREDNQLNEEVCLPDPTNCKTTLNLDATSEWNIGAAITQLPAGVTPRADRRIFGSKSVITVEIDPFGSNPLIHKMQFQIRGRPTEGATVRPYIDSQTSSEPINWYAYAIARHENHYRQFYTLEDPQAGFPWFSGNSQGWGIMQLDFGNQPLQATLAEIWNWQTNVQSGLDILREKRQEAVDRMNSPQPDVDAQGRVRQPLRPRGYRLQARIANGGTYVPDPNGDGSYRGARVDGGTDVPVPNEQSAACTFSDGGGPTIEEAMAMKRYNSNSGGNYLQWEGGQWVFHRLNTNGGPGGPFDYVNRVCKEVGQYP
jgi:hypothetical protein